MTEWALFLLPLVGALLTFAEPKRRVWLGAGASLVLLGTLVLALLSDTGATSRIAWGGGLEMSATLTPLSRMVAILVPAVAFTVLTYATAHEKAAGLRRLIALMLAFVGGMELLVIAGDLLTVLIGWELVGACSWALIGHRWHEDAPGRSANFAFIATRTGDLGLFVAAMAAFAGSGSFDFAALSTLPSPLLALVAAGVLVSAAAKSGQVPFSPWLFRAMDGPTSVSALLHSATMVAAGAYLLARLEPVLAPVLWFGPTVIAIGLTTALAGGIVALMQPHAKKLLAASTSAHYGLMFVATGAGFPLVAILHLVAHGFFKALLFLAAGIAGERAGDFQLRHMGFARVLPVTAVASGIGALALAGVPPLGGGWTKEQVIGSAGDHGFALAVAVMLAGALSAAYAARFQLMVFGRKKGDGGAYLPNWAEKSAAVLLALASLLLGLLWLPGLPDAMAAKFDATLPPSRTSELLLSLLLVASGLALGTILAKRPTLGTQGISQSLAEWVGLPAAIRLAVTEPVLALARLAGKADERIVTALARGVTKLGRLGSASFAKADKALVDRGIILTGQFGEWLAQVSSSIGEAVVDALPERTGGAVSLGGRYSARLQTGMSHQYYVAIAGGIALIVALTFLGT
ncbi:NADH dehydrogenase [Altererythrobacter sp. B11]|uniref:NADH-quinone oxidoreductase subunit 5 family protein n=1 Tax=Altererythrobacter sp. B11 TaxID=2060312 RepID=UPI000DC70779|nr:proton-conducting transporter membrane subunit [Altererythrobacter sp. B11]BBC71686.1 NADH dehydrogenase [Altererythrobacter sp. B11]